ncbi:hypothetical protein ZIOFF_059861 [Zingiber officinale]|uniref:Phosphofructokinase domain-containing protein n=1 Tax=Zingiber officinale TaxID=94328 RepID=A0A8J5FLT4_ZINOF|nr:hypothetical protein ZIOFF_059861 [Zingiber officinale]
MALDNKMMMRPKSVIDEVGFVIEGVPHFGDYLLDLLVVVHKNDLKGMHFRRARPRQKGGYKGFYSSNTINLTPKSVNDIHKRGGTILGTSRGGHDTSKIVNSIEDRACYYFRFVLYEAMELKEGWHSFMSLNVAVAGIPKTIDNNIAVIDKSFGFGTAVEEAQRAINATHVEAESVKNGIGLVKLMGRYSGFSSRDVDHFKTKMSINLRYVDPTYMIRAVPSNASDNVYCTLLAHSAIHGAMAGYTGFITGPVNGRHAYTPFHRITEMPNKVVITDRIWARMLSSTNQPSFLSSADVEEVRGGENEPPMQLLEDGKDCCSTPPPPNAAP